MPSLVFRLWEHVSRTFALVFPQLLTAHGPTKRGQKAEDEVATLQQIRAVNPEAGVRFLEHLVLESGRSLVVTRDPRS
jgi:hypothetical protein